MSTSCSSMPSSPLSSLTPPSSSDLLNPSMTSIHHRHTSTELQPLKGNDAKDIGGNGSVHDDGTDDAEKDRVSDSGFDPLELERRESFVGYSKNQTSWEDFLYPPHLPRKCQLLRRENIAIPASYLVVGLLQGLTGPLLNVLPVDLGATEAQQTTISYTRSLPASFKILFGFISDTIPIAGYRRKPYMIGGWFLCSWSFFLLMYVSDLDVHKHGFDEISNVTLVENTTLFESMNSTSAMLVSAKRLKEPPSMALLALCVLGFGTGFWMADVMADSVVAEKAKFEPIHSRGSVQSACYSYRFFGIMVAAPLSTYLYSAVGPFYVIFLAALLPLALMPAVFMMHEDTEITIPSVSAQCNEIWNTVCSRAVWQPMGFIYLFNALQVSNGAWRQFQVSVLHFTDADLNIILIIAYVLLYLGILFYKYYLMAWSWRMVYILTTLLTGFFSLLQVCLIKGMTFGLSNFWFALGDDAIAEFIEGIQFLPSTIMMVHLCPTGSEGASYAMFTTVHNAALMVSRAMSTMLLGIWNVSEAALLEGNLGGLIKLTLLTSFLQVFGIVFVGWLPHFKDDLMRLNEQNLGHSSVGGSVVLFVTLASLLYAVITGVLSIVAPGSMGES